MFDLTFIAVLKLAVVILLLATVIGAAHGWRKYGKYTRGLKSLRYPGYREHLLNRCIESGNCALLGLGSVLVPMLAVGLLAGAFIFLFS